mmetsp:Transcript_56258/g.67773  ORF Transcript_56258/g.67773 Transcript_56258/m.67773 type:complete len:171 (+) Transcript_56258:79-591(+)
MTRQCVQCDKYKNRRSFSSNQWAKGEDSSRCTTCVCGVFGCNKCDKIFRDRNSLKMHMQVHRAKNVACPVCGDRRFGAGANAVMHVERGHCRGCKGRDSARRHIYEFASCQSAMRPFMAYAPQLLYGGYSCGSVPNFPYRCPQCYMSYQQLSQLMQHQYQKHSNNDMLTF